jgi:hypothetical protein
LKIRSIISALVEVAAAVVAVALQRLVVVEVGAQLEVEASQLARQLPTSYLLQAETRGLLVGAVAEVQSEEAVLPPREIQRQSGLPLVGVATMAAEQLGRPLLVQLPWAAAAVIQLAVAAPPTLAIQRRQAALPSAAVEEALLVVADRQTRETLHSLWVEVAVLTAAGVYSTMALVVQLEC